MDKTFEVGYYCDTFKHKYDIQTVQAFTFDALPTQS